MEKKYVYDLHTDHTDWLEKLAFYKDEIKVMESRVAEIASKNSKPEVRAFVEQFQNRLIIQKEHLDILKHEINEHEGYLQKNIDNNPVAADHRKLNDHPKHREAMESYEKIFNEFRKELMGFLSKWM